MIASFRDAWLREFFIDDRRSKHIPAELEDRLFRKLQILDDATQDLDLRVPPGNRWEHLQGNLKGWNAIRVNLQWRLIFKWHSGRGEAVDVYLDDHSYR